MANYPVKPKKKRYTKWLLIALASFALAISLGLMALFPKATSTLDEIHEPLTRQVSAKRPEKIVLEEKEPLSILLLGVDERENDKGRSDTIVVLTVNPSAQSIKMVSIPRDTYTEIADMGRYDKINHAFAFGGAEMSLETVEHLLDIPIDYVMQINMEGFKDIIDALGGITVDNEFAFDGFSEGEILLSGEDALDFVRMRKEDPDGDFGRQNRQKQVLKSVLAKTASANTLFNYSKIMDALGDNVKTNMSFSEMMDVQSNYRSAINSIEQLNFERGSGEIMNGIWYYRMDDGELTEIQNLLKEHLKME